MSNNMHPVTRNRGMAASDLYKKTDTGALQNVIADQIRLIDSKISSTHHIGGSQIYHELPSIFDINNMPKSDAQTLVYSELIMIYGNPEPQGKGYDVSIEMGPRSFLRVRWINGLDDEDRVLRNKIIQSRMSHEPKTRGRSY